MIHNEEKNQPVETNSEQTQVLRKGHENSSYNLLPYSQKVKWKHRIY